MAFAEFDSGASIHCGHGFAIHTGDFNDWSSFILLQHRLLVRHVAGFAERQQIFGSLHYNDGENGKDMT